MPWSRVILQAPAGEFWAAAGLAMALVGLLTWQALRFLHRKRVMENMPTSLLRSAAQGYVKLEGMARLLEGDPILAGLTGQHCVWYRYKVEQRERQAGSRGHGESRWRTVDAATSEHLFALTDDTGTCVVDPDGATVTPSERNCWYGNSRLPPRISGDAGWRAWVGYLGLGGSYRYTEERIRVGAPLVALGEFRSHAGMASTAVSSVDLAALLREWKADSRTLKARFDRDRNGEIDAEEWEAARRAAQAELARDTPRADLPPAVDTLIDTGDARYPFLLAADTEARLRQRAQGYMAVCGALAGVGALLVLSCVLARLSAT